MNIWLWAASSAGTALFLTGLLRRYALTCSILDIPNQRSSHSVPTPRGGGIAIVLTFLGSLGFLGASGMLTTSALVAFAGAGAWVAVIGFVDDHRSIPARWRLPAHFFGAVWVLAWLGGLPPLPAFGLMLNPGWLGQLTAALYLVWLLNLYNFMDGIDGIAGIEAITVCAGGGLLLWITAPNAYLWILPIYLMASVAGFLFWNFPSAKIFMGDAGSGFLGLMLGAFSIQTAWLAPRLFWSWVILLGVFIVDATVTLVRRVIRGEKFYEAHRSHAYQHASRLYRSHWKVSLAAGMINIFWLLPLATLVAKGGVDGPLGVAIAYAPLGWAAFGYHAGARELQ